MKKKICLLLACLLVLSLAACQNNAEGSQSGPDNQGQQGGQTPEPEDGDGQGAGGFDTSKTINVVSREDGSGTRGAFIELLGIEQKGEDGSKTDRTTQEAAIVNKTDVMLATIAGDPYSIGYVSSGSLSDKVRALKIGGVEPTSDNIQNGSYTLARPFNIATKGAPDGLAADFISFILSQEGQQVISDGYVPVDGEAPAYAGTRPAGKITVGGSSSVSPIMEKLIAAYQQLNPDAEIELQTSDSSSGMSGAIEGILDIGMASRELKDAELAELTASPIAIDGIAVIVSPENPLDDLTGEQVASIFMGETTVWADAEK